MKTCLTTSLSRPARYVGQKSPLDPGASLEVANGQALSRQEGSAGQVLSDRQRAPFDIFPRQMLMARLHHRNSIVRYHKSVAEMALFSAIAIRVWVMSTQRMERTGQWVVFTNGNGRKGSQVREDRGDEALRLSKLELTRDAVQKFR